MKTREQEQFLGKKEKIINLMLSRLMTNDK